MTTKEYIPTLLPSEMNNFHAHSTSWKPLLSSQNNQDFHINKLEDISDKSNFHVLPHRKTVHDFIFLKKGISKRSKGLNKYEFGPSSLFKGLLLGKKYKKISCKLYCWAILIWFQLRFVSSRNVHGYFQSTE